MNERVEGLAGEWTAGDGAGTSAPRDVVQVVFSWGDGQSRTVLGVTELRSGGSLSMGEAGDLLVPAAVLGAERVEVVRYGSDDCAMAFPPPRARLRVDGWERSEASAVIEPGHVVELLVGGFVVRLARMRAASRVAGAPLEGLRRSGVAFFAGSAIAHVAAFAAVALFSPALGATEEDPFDADRLLLMQRLLNAQAAQEAEEQPGAQHEREGGDANAGSPARGAEGAAGRPVPRDEGRWAARGTARPEEATLPRERQLAAAASWGILGVLASALPSDPNAPVVSWGSTLNGADDASAVGHLYGRTIGDAAGIGGWGLTGDDEGGGGHANAIGLTDFSRLGRTGTCIGPGPCDGIGVSRGGTNRGYVPHFKGPRYGDPHSNGHLPPEVIQRIVRQNDGRYRFCYEKALQANPNLQGRVTVRFLIDRGGAVAVASDAGSDIPDEGVRKCVVTAFTSLSFPAPESGVVTVVYPIAFNPE
jgi:hypothetical protein